MSGGTAPGEEAPAIRLAGELAWSRPGFELDVALDLEARSIGLFGPSGAGKSTLLRLIAGLERPDRGWLRLGERVLVDTARGIFVPPEERRVAVVFQDHRLFPHRTVAGNLRYGAWRTRRFGSVSHASVGFEEVVDLLRLGPLLDRRPRHLSGGEAQRVNLGRALLARPRLVLLDEPFAALDAGLRRELFPFLERLRDRLAVPFVHVSHALFEIERLCEHAVFLEGGRVLGAGPVAEALGEPPLLALAARLGLESVLIAEVEPDDSGGWAHLGGHRIALPDALPPGTGRVVLRVAPEEVLLATRPLAAISARIRLPGRVARLDPIGPGRVMVTVDTGSGMVRALITAEAVDELAVEAGSSVFCYLKSVALRPSPHLG